VMSGGHWFGEVTSMTGVAGLRVLEAERFTQEGRTRGPYLRGEDSAGADQNGLLS